MSIKMERDTRLDSIKFVLIIFVVLGHMLECGGDNVWNDKMHTFIYSFHMPAFIYVSGYVFRRTADRVKFWKGILNLIVVYGTFQVLFFGDPLRYYTGGGKSLTINGLCGNIAQIYQPASVLWYLVSLTAWRIVTQFVPSGVLDNRKRFLILSLLVSIAASFIPLGRELSFQRSCAFYPYFLLGYYEGQCRMGNMLKGGEKKKLCWGIISAYAILVGAAPHIPMSMLVQFFSFWEKPLTPILRILSYIWMLPLVWAVLNVIPNRSYFSKEGRNTLFYYIYHVYLVYLVQRLIEYFSLPFTLPYMLLYTFFAMGIMFVLRRIGLLNKILHPLR